MINYQKVGLTGGIGCGKSTALTILKELGCFTVDTDAICHELYESSQELKKSIEDKWGIKVFDKKGQITRKEIAKIVFNDKKELEWLNSTIHPLIFKEVDKRTKLSSSQLKIIIYDVPLLFEVNWEKMFSKIISIWSPRKLQLERLRLRGWSDEEINSRLNSQYSVDKKLERADFGIINSGSLEMLKLQCEKIIFKLIRGNNDN